MTMFGKRVEEGIDLFLEKNVPTNPSKWAYYKAQAKKKFDVYPSAYANGWAAKQYKAAGGGWRKEKKKKREVVEDVGIYKEVNLNEVGSTKNLRKQYQKIFDDNKEVLPQLIKGRGGTCFQPVTDHYNAPKNKYSAFICLTDGEAPNPDNCPQNALWVHSSRSKINERLTGLKIQLN